MTTCQSRPRPMGDVAVDRVGIGDLVHVGHACYGREHQSHSTTMCIALPNAEFIDSHWMAPLIYRLRRLAVRLLRRILVKSPVLDASGLSRFLPLFPMLLAVLPKDRHGASRIAVRIRAVPAPPPILQRRTPAYLTATASACGLRRTLSRTYGHSVPHLLVW